MSAPVQPIADACAAVIAAAIEDAVADYPNATPATQARHAVRALAAEGWHFTTEPPAALAAATEGGTR
ncbi:hypothetical protein [Streptomyces sp. SPB78]|uniref:Uncharacterized protein n=1 Tax=Streptomyces phage SF3 TaxID=1690818 RepID=A0A0M4S3F5_9CAUD|nr:hypothetical protein [Streptomyces sp. SPB78]YP_009213185.1 hypothetical protein AVV12_gp58 [Streptomyces phage SF3]ALF00189.1 hypothetical protein SF3_580 [Streptomyces phage SF3]